MGDSKLTNDENNSTIDPAIADAAGWTFKVANLAFNIWRSIQSTKQNTENMATLSRYHDIEMAKLEEIMDYQKWSTAVGQAANLISLIDENFSKLMRVSTALSDVNAPADISEEDAAEIIAERIVTFYDYANGEGDIVNTTDSYGKRLTVGENTIEPLISAFASDIAGYSGSEFTPSFVTAQYCLAEIFRYEKALCALAFYRQLLKAFPANTKASITGANIRKLDLENLGDAATIEALIKEDSSNHMSKIMDCSNTAVWDTASDRFSPKLDIGDFGEDKVISWDELDYDDGDRVSKLIQEVHCGSMIIPQDDSNKPNAVVGIKLNKGVRKYTFASAPMEEDGLSLRLHFAPIDEILNGHGFSDDDGAKTPITVSTMLATDDEDAECDTRVPIDDHFTLGTDKVKHMSVAHIGSSQHDGGKIKIVTGARLSQTLCDSDDSTKTFNAMCVSLHMQTYDPEAGTLANDGAWYTPPIDKGLHDMTGRINSGDPENYSAESWDDAEPELFILSNATQEPPTMLRGAILNRKAHKTNIDVYTYWPLTG